MFGIKFKKLLKKEDKTEEEKNLIRRYQKYSPLITAPCTMNRLCREFENINFDIKFSKDPTTKTKTASKSMLPNFTDEFAGSFSQERLDAVKKMYQEFSAKMSIRHLENILMALPTPTSAEDFAELRTTIYDGIITDLQASLASLEMGGKEFLYYCSVLAPKYTNFNWSFAWSILEDQIVDLIPSGETFCPIRIPKDATDPHDTAQQQSQPAEDATTVVDYLGERFALIKIIKPEEIGGEEDTTAYEE